MNGRIELKCGHRASELYPGECIFHCVPVAAQPNPETDLVAIARDEVIKSARAWAKVFREGWKPRWQPEDDLLSALSLLESREEIARQQTEKK